MSDAVLTALIGGAVSLAVGIFSAVIAARSAANEVQKKLEIAQAVTDTKLEELTREVRTHNGFAQRMPVLENRIETLEKAAAK